MNNLNLTLQEAYDEIMRLQSIIAEFPTELTPERIRSDLVDSYPNANWELFEDYEIHQLHLNAEQEAFDGDVYTTFLRNAMKTRGGKFDEDDGDFEND